MLFSNHLVNIAYIHEEGMKTKHFKGKKGA